MNNDTLAPELRAITAAANRLHDVLGLRSVQMDLVHGAFSDFQAGFPLLECTPQSLNDVIHRVASQRIHQIKEAGELGDLH